MMVRSRGNKHPLRHQVDGKKGKRTPPVLCIKSRVYLIARIEDIISGTGIKFSNAASPDLMEMMSELSKYPQW